MARQTDDREITTRNARGKLAPRREPYWRGLDAGVAIGYRSARNGGGTWVARFGGGGGYRQESLGRADDAVTADGATVLDYKQAVTKAKAWASRTLLVAAGHEAEDERERGPYTVGRALDDYLEHFQGKRGVGSASAAGDDGPQTKRARRLVNELRTTIEAHIRPAFGTIPLAALATKRITAWHHALAVAPARVRRSRTSAEATPAGRAADPRARQATANRVLTVLRAALNHAFRDGRIPSDAAWRRVEPFRAVDVGRVRYLADDEQTRLMNACPADFRRLVTAALLTGCRYGELIALRVADVDLEAGTLSVARSKSGKPRSAVLTPEGVEFFRRTMVGKPHDGLIFTRDWSRRGPPGGAWAKSHQFRPLQDACKTARIAPAISFHILRHTHATRLAGKGVPIAFIAEQLGHADTRVTTRHYAHVAPNHVADAIRAAFGTIGVAHEPHAAVPLRVGRE